VRKVTAGLTHHALNTECLPPREGGGKAVQLVTVRLCSLGTRDSLIWGAAAGPGMLRGEADMWAREKSRHSRPWSPSDWIHYFHTFDLRV